jgi:ribosomal protein L17
MRHATPRKAEAQKEAVTETPSIRALMYQEAWLTTVTPDDVRAIGQALIARAKQGDVPASRLVLDRVLGTSAVASWESRAELEDRAKLEKYFKLT